LDKRTAQIVFMENTVDEQERSENLGSRNCSAL